MVLFMKVQHQIQRQLSQPAGLNRIGAILAEGKDLNRTALAKQVCSDYGFRDARGHLQIASCLAALRTPEHSERVRLPARQTPGGSCVRSRETTPVTAAREVPSTVDQVLGLSLILVTTTEQKELWYGLMAREHPQGARPMVGPQLRYLIGSEHGWLGGIGIGASALQLAARDRWINWDAETRRGQLHRIVGLSRFLIRPDIHCRNLASQVLGQLWRRSGTDFDTRYGYRPWLVETFVSPPYDGTSLRAANWRYWGETAGRGRQDRCRQATAGRKAIYIYELENDWRNRLGVTPATPPAIEPLGPADDLEGPTWAAAEFAEAPLGDARLGQRLVKIAGIQAEKPMASFPAAAQGDRAQIKEYYRFLDQPDNSAVTSKAILQPHRARTLRRMQAESVVLCL